VGPAVLAGIVRKDAVARFDLNQFKRVATDDRNRRIIRPSDSEMRM
jgi:hypothetical protein